MSPKNSLPPAGVPSSGNAKYAVLALLMVAGAGGLFLWRSASNKAARAPAPLPPVASASAAPSENPKLDDMPPPPPSSEIEEEPQAKAHRAAGGGSLGCEGKCSGTASTELEQALTVRASQARRCYNQALAQDSSLKGHVTVALRIGPNGNVCSSAVASNDMGSPLVANCAANVFRAVQGYPSPRGGCIDAKVPLSFVPQGQ